MTTLNETSPLLTVTDSLSGVTRRWAVGWALLPIGAVAIRILSSPGAAAWRAESQPALWAFLLFFWMTGAVLASWRHEIRVHQDGSARERFHFLGLVREHSFEPGEVGTAEARRGRRGRGLLVLRGSERTAILSCKDLETADSLARTLQGLSTTGD